MIDWIRCNITEGVPREILNNTNGVQRTEQISITATNSKYAFLVILRRAENEHLITPLFIF